MDKPWRIRMLVFAGVAALAIAGYLYFQHHLFWQAATEHFIGPFERDASRFDVVAQECEEEGLREELDGAGDWLNPPRLMRGRRFLSGAPGLEYVANYELWLMIVKHDPRSNSVGLVCEYALDGTGVKRVYAPDAES